MDSFIANGAAFVNVTTYYHNTKRVFKAKIGTTSLYVLETERRGFTWFQDDDEHEQSIGAENIQDAARIAFDACHQRAQVLVDEFARLKRESQDAKGDG